MEGPYLAARKGGQSVCRIIPPLSLVYASTSSDSCVAGYGQGRGDSAPVSARGKASIPQPPSLSFQELRFSPPQGGLPFVPASRLPIPGPRKRCRFVKNRLAGDTHACLSAPSTLALARSAIDLLPAGAITPEFAVNAGLTHRLRGCMMGPAIVLMSPRRRSHPPMATSHRVSSRIDHVCIVSALAASNSLWNSLPESTTAP